MSARGTITSSTRSVPKRRMRSSISRSSMENASSSPADRSAFSSVSRRVAGALGRPSFAMSPVNQLWVGSPESECLSECLLLIALSLAAMAFDGGVGIGHPERRQDLGLEPFHGLGLDLRVVVEPQEVQEAMNDEMLKVVKRGNALLRRLPLQGLHRQHDIAEVAGICRARG